MPKGDLTKALKKRQEKAHELEDKIIEKIEEHPYGLTLYDLASLLQVTPLGIQKAIDRIKNIDEKIVIKERKRKNQIAKFYFPKNLQEQKSSNYFEIDVSNQKVDWKSNAIIYVDMRNNQIFVYAKQNPSLEKQFFSQIIPIHVESKKVSFVIPEKISYGFNAENKSPNVIIKKDYLEINYSEKKFQLPEIKGAKILILDDQDEITIKNIKNVLSERHDVEYVTDQKVAINRIKAKKYDFLILDWILDNVPLKHKNIMNEFKQKNPKGKAVIITGGDYSKEDVIKYTPKGITWFFDKTIDRLPYKIEDELRSVLKIE